MLLLLPLYVHLFAAPLSACLLLIGMDLLLRTPSLLSCRIIIAASLELAPLQSPSTTTAAMDDIGTLR